MKSSRKMRTKRMSVWLLVKFVLCKWSKTIQEIKIANLLLILQVWKIGICAKITSKILGDYFANKSWKGLDDGYHQDDSLEIKKGLAGTSVGYTSEKSNWRFVEFVHFVEFKVYSIKFLIELFDNRDSSV